MEQTIFNFGTDNTIKELQKAYVKMFIKKINFELMQKNCYLNILPNFYDTCFVCEDWKFKRDLTPDENFVFWVGDNVFLTKHYLKIMIDYFLKM
jgi:hypothetical protein